MRVSCEYGVQRREKHIQLTTSYQPRDVGIGGDLPVWDFLNGSIGGSEESGGLFTLLRHYVDIDCDNDCTLCVAVGT